MTPHQEFEKSTLQRVLYTGIALITISMLFFMRGLGDHSFVSQIVPAIVVPGVFYAIGILIYRYLNAPLAAPGMVATGAWLVGVALVHFYERLYALPTALQALSWLICSCLAAIIITITGHRIRLWLIVPLVPIVQVNALWAVFSMVGVSILWLPALSLIIIPIWWEMRASKGRWQSVYRLSSLVFGGLMLLFACWIPFSTPTSLFWTWGTAAVLIAALGFRHRMPQFAPLAVCLTTGTILLGLPVVLWASMLLVLSIATFVYLQRLPEQDENAGKAWWVQSCLALAIVLGGLSALIAEWLFTWNIAAVYPDPILILIGVGGVFVRFGMHRERQAAIHAGLWLLASAWAHLYFKLVNTIEIYGMWLALFAACVLLIQRLFTSPRKEKHKAARTVVESVLHWPGADLAIGLSMIVLCWTATHITDYAPIIMTLTFSVVIGVWLITSLLYRIPVLLYLSVCIAPIPYAILLMIVSPVFYSLPVIGLAWQFFGILLAGIGHATPRYRPAMRLPFFIAGYALLIFGFGTAINNPVFFLASLTILMLAFMTTAVIVIFDQHPMWNLVVNRLISRESHPFAHRYIQHTFLFLSAWIAGVWLYLVLGHTGLSWSQHGLSLVVFSCLAFLLGIALNRFPGVVGLPLLSIGWVLWLVGLMEVFYSQTEALIAIVLGLVAASEALRRTRQLVWIPLLVLQVLFSALQLSWLLQLPAPDVLLLTSFGIGIFGLLRVRQAERGGQLTELIGVALMIGIWAVRPALDAPLGLFALTLLATFIYRTPPMIWSNQAALLLVLFQFRHQVNPYGLLAMGCAQLVLGAELVWRLRQRRLQRLVRLITHAHDWATPFLMIGALCTSAALMLLSRQIPGNQFFVICSGMALLLALYTVRLRLLHLPYVVLLIIGVGILHLLWPVPVETIRPARGAALQGLMLLAFGLVAVGLTLWGVGSVMMHRRYAIPREFKGIVILWLRPLLAVSWVSGMSSLAVWIVVMLFSPMPTAINLVTGCGVAIFLLAVYQRQPQFLFLLIGASTVLGFCWLMVLNLLDVLTPALATLPTGLALFLIARAIQHPKRFYFDYSGALLWMIGAITSVERSNVFSLASIDYFGYAAALLGIGAIFGRKAVIFTGGVLASIGVGACVGHVNIWLIPMICGVVLVGGTLFLETRFATVRAWKQQAQAFWQRLE